MQHGRLAYVGENERMRTTPVFAYIRMSRCKAGLRATRRMSSEALQGHLNTIAEVYEQVEFPSAGACSSYIEGAILSMIGLWSCTSQHAYKQFRGFYEIHAGPGVKQRRRVEDGSFIFTSSTELIGLYSMAPWGRIALDVEQLRIAQATSTIKKYADHLTIAGVHVDGVFILSHSFNAGEIYDKIVDEHRFPDGSPMFHLKNEPACKVPTWKQTDVERSQTLIFIRPQWKTFEEWDVPDVDALANLVVEHNGLMLQGPGGVGKTVLLRKLMQVLQQSVPGKHLAMALRHCTAMLMCGKTIAHYLHKYRLKGGAPKAGTIVIIDEWSEVQLHTWVELAQWKLVGVIFIIVGDADGQRKPIFDKWQDAMDAKDIRQSQLIHELCGGLRLKLSVYKRGTDQVLFDRYFALYDIADDDAKVPQIVEQMRGLYPYNANVACEFYFVISHKKRMILNHALNWLMAERHAKLEFIPSFGEKPGMTMQPQDMIIWEGMELLCYSRRYAKNSPVTGAVYVVLGWDGSRVAVTLHDDYVGERLIEAPAADAAKPVEEGEDDEDAQSDPGALEALEALEESSEDRGCTQETQEGERGPASATRPGLREHPRANHAEVRGVDGLGQPQHDHARRHHSDVPTDEGLRSPFRHRAAAARLDGRHRDEVRPGRLRPSQESERVESGAPE